jgi:hypothetical protein
VPAHFRDAARLCGLLVCLALTGCGLTNKKAPPPPVEVAIASPYAGVHTLAIAPAINLSGSRDFDPLVVSDTLYGELQQVSGLNVLPLNKTLLAMQRLGVRSIEDPKGAQRLAAALNADGLVVPAVTAYDPYNPPNVGMILQMYTPATGRPVAIAVRPNTSTSAEEYAGQPVSQVNGVFNATNQSVLRELRGYAAGRTEYDSALQEKKFLVNSDLYMRFVCHAMVRRLMEVESARGADR